MSFRVAFVCTGNICRSPMAQAITESLLEERGVTGVEVDSFGFDRWHVGQEADPRAMQTLRAHGLDLKHKARTITPEDIADRDLILAIDRGHEGDLRALANTVEDGAKVRLLRSYDPDADSPDVPDPYYGGSEGFERVFTMLQTACRGLVEELAQR
jgi:low molecular weight protein-tyrosine phosphatase